MDSAPSMPKKKFRDITVSWMFPRMGILFVVLLALNFWSFHATQTNEILLLKQSNKILLKHDKSQVPPDQFSVAYKQSLGLFDDIPDRAWKLLQQRVKARVNHRDTNNPMQGSSNSPAWYQQNYEPDFGCQHEVRVGVMGDGG